MVGIKYRCRILNSPSKTYIKCRRYNVEGLKNKDLLEAYQNKLNERLNNIEYEEQTINNNWKNIQNAIKSSAEEIMGYQDRTKNKEWYDGECRDAVERRNALRMQWLLRPTRRREAEYRIARSEAKKICKKKKRSFINDFILKM